MKIFFFYSITLATTFLMANQVSAQPAPGTGARPGVTTGGGGGGGIPSASPPGAPVVGGGGSGGAPVVGGGGSGGAPVVGGGGGGGIPSGSGGGSVTINNPLKANSITELFMDLIEVVLVFATPLIVFFIIYAGFLYVTAQGNPEKISQATKALLYSVIGGVLILGAFVILRVIEGTVNAITI